MLESTIEEVFLEVGEVPVVVSETKALVVALEVREVLMVPHESEGSGGGTGPSWSVGVRRRGTVRQQGLGEPIRAGATYNAADKLEVLEELAIKGDAEDITILPKAAPRPNFGDGAKGKLLNDQG